MAVEQTNTGEESFRRVAFREAWKGRTRAFWSIAALGVVLGAAIGLAAPFVPVIASAILPESLGVGSYLFSNAVSAILPSMATFAAYGMGVGALVGGILGGPSGSIGAMVEKAEKRGILIAAQGTDNPNPTIESEQTKSNPKYINPKVGAVFAMLGAVGGTIMVAAASVATGGLAGVAGMGLIPGASIALGSAPSAAAVGSYVIGVMGLFGAMFGINGPKIATEMQDFTGRILNGELLGTNWEKNKAVVIEQKPDAPAQSAQLQTEPVIGKHASRVLSERPASAKIDSYRDFVSSHAQQGEMGAAVNL